MAFTSDKGKLSFNPPSVISDIFGPIKDAYTPVDEERFNTLSTAFTKLSAKGEKGKEGIDKMVTAQKKLGNGFDLVANGCKNANGEFDASQMTYANYTKAVEKANKANKNLTVGQRAMSKVKSFGSNLLSSALNMGTGMLAGVAINGVISLIDSWVHRSENLIEAGKQAESEIQNLNQEYGNHKTTVESVIDSYDALRSKVDLKTNRNMGLSTDQYQQFLSVFLC